MFSLIVALMLLQPVDLMLDDSDSAAIDGAGAPAALEEPPPCGVNSNERCC